jgi:protein-S-isoprenylcysteine O-methyltransferase Ste14
VGNLHAFFLTICHAERSEASSTFVKAHKNPKSQKPNSKHCRAELCGLESEIWNLVFDLYLYLLNYTSMGLIEDFKKKGNWLFKKRSFIPIFLYIIAAISLFLTDKEIVDFQNIYWMIGCLSLSFIGLIIRIITVGLTPKGTSGRNTSSGQVAEQLNTKGIYSVVRHPLYLGNFLMWLGLIIYVGIPEFIIFAVFFFWIYYERIMFAEEEFIRNKFGQSFVDWSKKTPAFIPSFKNHVKSNLDFSWKSVLRREYSGFFATFFSFILINFLKKYFYFGEYIPNYFWIYATAIAFVIFITLRSLKKYTKVLHTEDRD